MLDVRFEIVKGSLNALKELDMDYRPEFHGVLGIPEDDWALLRQKQPWLPNQARRARITLERALQEAVRLAEMPVYTLPMEFVAATIATLVEGINQMTAASFTFQAFEGKKLVDGNHNEVDAMEYVTPMRLFTEVLYAKENVMQELIAPIDDLSRSTRGPAPKAKPKTRKERQETLNDGDYS